MTRNKRIFVFDIDGTLLNLNGLGMISLTQAFEKIFEKEINIDGIKPFGKTDPLIWNEICKNNEIEEDFFLVNKKAVLKKYVEILSGYLKETKKEHLIAGVAETLNYLSLNNNILTVLTGNIAEASELKLKHYNIFDYFVAGAYGCESNDRNRLAPILFKKLKKLDYALTDKEIYIVGDTPSDIECAVTNNLKCIAVSTGGYTHEELEKYSPDYLINNLTEIKQLPI